MPGKNLSRPCRRPGKSFEASGFFAFGSRVKVVGERTARSNGLSSSVRSKKLLGPLGKHLADFPALALHAASQSGATGRDEYPASRDRKRLTRARPDGAGRRAGLTVVEGAGAQPLQPFPDPSRSLLGSPERGKHLQPLGKLPRPGQIPLIRVPPI